MTGNHRPISAEDFSRIAEALHWLHAAQVQARRFLVAFADQRPKRTQRIGASDWRLGFYSTEAHLLIVTMQNLITSWDRLPDTITAPQVSDQIRTATSLLRNILEHWDEQKASFSNPAIQKERSGKLFAELFPAFSAWSFGWSNNPGQGSRIGGALHVEAALQEMANLESALTPMWRQGLHDVGLLPCRGPVVEFDPGSTPMQTPDAVAVAAFAGHARAAITIIDGCHAVVLAVVETDPEPGVEGCPWWINSSCGPHGWICSGGGNGSGGWHCIDSESQKGVAYVGGAAPTGADVVEIRFRGASVDVPVEDGYFAWACFDALPDEWVDIGRAPS